MLIMADRRLLAGSLLVLIGLLFALDNFGFIPWELSFLTSWPTLLIVIGLFMAFANRNKVVGIIMILVGGFYLARDFFDLWRYGWSDLWPFILIAVGILIIVRKRIHDSYDSTIESSDQESDIDRIEDMNILGGGEKVISSRNFRGGKITNILGGGEYDLTGATLSGGRNVIDIFAMFGGASFKVPSDWNVRVEVTSILGGFSDKRKIDPSAIPDPRKELFIRGVVIMGGGELKN